MTTTLRIIACVGDSQTDSDGGFGVHGFDTWPAKLQRHLIGQGYNVRARSFGVSGETTTGLLARIQDVFYYGRPDVGVIYEGVNDPGAAISQAQTQANIEAACLAFKHAAVGDGISSGATVAGQANLPATGKLGDRYVVLTDSSSTGGTAAWDAVNHHATITGSVAADGNGQKQAVWEFRYAAAGELGWGRVALKTTIPLTDSSGNPLGAKTILICSTNYKNFVTGGDTLVTPEATYAAVRAAQQAAATAQTGNGATVVYADLYTLQKGLIQAGTVVNSAVSGTYDSATSWHYKQDNQHHNAFGQGLVANAVLAAVTWATALA